ncbi:AP-4 complex accessory subunit Tepsin isoform X2 [Leuresthes tenuis]|uniref:AP-4 complex accessory subunit Tepsin isoform X2 n=1 Tax=Leuresthes tenuis TaxID=355514 RepID=UPI003B50FB75
MASFMERLAFLQKVPTLMKATADDENPCPGYLFQEIGKISHESLGCGQCLLEYLLERLQVESCHVKLKVLKIFVHLCGHGSNNFLTELRRNSTFIQQASVYSGPPDPIHGTALYQKVRHTAQEVARLLFTDAVSTKSSIPPHSVAPPTMGMGSATPHRSGLQGFGYNPGKQGTASDSLLDKIQKAAEVVASAVLPPTEHQGIRLHDNNYRAVVAPSAPIEVAVPACAYNLPAGRPKVTQRCPGQVGGGWEETDSGNSSSHNSSQDMAANSRASVGSKSAGTGSQSGASRESSGDLSDRVEAMQLGDCGQEMALINRLTEGSRVFLTREESQHFIKECFILNCEVVVELLSSKLQDPSYTVKMRALCAVACLMTSDLLSLEQMFGATQRRLHQLSKGPSGPVANKATKILRQFEALMGGSPHATKQDTVNSSHEATTNQHHTSVCSGSMLPTYSAENTDLKLNQPVGVAPPSNCSSSPSSLELTLRCSKEELLNDDDDEEKLDSIWQESVENQGGSVRTDEIKPSESPELIGDRSPPLSPEPQSVLVHPSRPSLFSGMELVTKGRPLCEREASCAESDRTDGSLSKNQTRHNPDCPVNSAKACVGTSEVASSCSRVASDRAQSVSAFSFLNS